MFSSNLLFFQTASIIFDVYFCGPTVVVMPS